MATIEFPVYDWLPFRNDEFSTNITTTLLLQQQQYNTTTKDHTFFVQEDKLYARYEFSELNYDFAIPFFLLLILAEIFSQFITKRKLYRINDSFSSLSCGVTQQLVGKLLTNYVFRTIPYAFCFHLFHGGSERALVSSFMDIGMTSWYWWMVLIFYDHQYYWSHRYAHEWNIGWAGHNVHHSSEEYNLTSALRQGAYQDCTTFIFYIPMAIAGIHPFFFSIHSNINLVGQFWFHTRAITKLPSTILEWILNTPSHHRVHHGRNEYCLDKNYGGVLIIFDRIYGTFEAEQELKEEDPIRKEKSNVVYGLTTPLTTFDPIQTQNHLMVSIYQTCTAISSSNSSNVIFSGKSQWFIWWNRLQVIFRGPGWNPFAQSWYECPQVLMPPSKNEMYDPIVDSSIEKYLATVHFVLIFILYLLHMDTKSFNSLLIHLSQFIFIYLSLSCISKIYENDNSKRLVEIIRLLLTNCLLLLNMRYGENHMIIANILPGQSILFHPLFGGEIISIGHVFLLINLVSLVYWWLFAKISIKIMKSKQQ